MLGRVRDLAVQAANDTNDAAARTAIGAEITALVAEVGRIGADTTFGGATLFSATALNFQVGSEGSGGNQIAVTVGVLTTASTGGVDISSLSVADATAARATIETVDSAIAGVSTSRGGLGAVQNRLESTIANLQVTTENLVASESPDPRHRHGRGNGRIHQEPDPAAGRYLHAGPGQRPAPVGPEPAGLVTQLNAGARWWAPA